MKKIFLIFIILLLHSVKNLSSNEIEEGKESLKFENYEQAYDSFNKCTSDCLENAENCNQEHFLCMLEMGRMLEKGLAEKNESRQERLRKAKFWYKYCSDRGSEICAVKLSTLNPGTQFIVKSVQEKLFDLGYPIMRDDIPGTETFSAIKQFQSKEGLRVEFPIEPEEWLILNNVLERAIANKENNNYEMNIGTPTDYATGIWVGEKDKLYVLTVSHFANGCQKIRSNKLGLRILKVDNRNDLALLESNDENNANFSAAKFPSEGIYENDKIYVFGYPRQTILGKSETSEGEIISLKSSEDDRSKIIISADLDLHSSGSPVINDKGLVIGTVSSKIISGSTSTFWRLIKEKVKLRVMSKGHKEAVSIYAIRSFLDENNIKYLTYNFKTKEREKIVFEAKKYTIRLECWGKKN